MRYYDWSLKPSDKDLFTFAYPGGWKCTEEIIEDADAEAIASLVDMSKKFYACCAKCNKITHSSSQTRYTNPVSHARSCFDELEEKCHEHMKNLYYGYEDQAVKVQQGLLKAM